MRTFDDFAVYVFVRQDLPEQDQRIQIAHAVLKMSLCWFGLKRTEEKDMIWDPLFDGEEIGVPDYRIVELDGGADRKAFERTVRKMKERGIQYVVYADSDHKDWGDTAIATVPISKEQALPLANYRLRRNSPPSPASGEVALDGQRGASSACVAQLD